MAEQDAVLDKAKRRLELQDRLDQMSLEDAEDVYQKLKAMALEGNGDLAAIRLILDRVWPSRRGATCKFDLGGAARSPAELGQRMDKVIEAMAAGELTVEEGEKLIAPWRRSDCSPCRSFSRPLPRCS
jgi:hypothetical protein